MSGLVFVLDDDYQIRELLQSEFESAGYETIVASNARDVVERSGNEQPDVIVMDVDMRQPPNGWEATRALKSDPKTCNIPVILITGRVGKAERELCFSCGCDDYVEKGDHLDQLLESVRMLIATRATQ